MIPLDDYGSVTAMVMMVAPTLVAMPAAVMMVVMPTMVIVILDHNSFCASHCRYG
jgi:hypothetical protein